MTKDVLFNSKTYVSKSLKIKIEEDTKLNIPSNKIIKPPQANDCICNKHQNRFFRKKRKEENKQ